MYNFLHTSYFNNTVSTYLWVLFFIILAIILKRFISKYFATLLFKLVARTGKKLNKLAFIGLILQPLEVFLFLFISFVALNRLNYPKELDFIIYKVSLFQVVDAASSIALVITFTWLCLRAIDFIAMILEESATKTSDHTESQLIVFFKDFFKMILIIIGFLMILRFGFNKDIGNLVTGLSLVGAALALATKESLENLIASFIIFFDKPFTVGDTVKVNNLTGSIEKIGLRSTRIRTEEKTYISVPNKQMVDSIIDNLSLRTQRRVTTNLEISLSVKMTDLKELTPAIVKLLNLPEIQNHSVYLKDTGRNAHIIEVMYFTDINQTLADFNAMRETINLSIIALLETKNIPLAGSTSNIIVMDNK